MRTTLGIEAAAEHVEVGEGNALLFYDGRYGSARQD